MPDPARCREGRLLEAVSVPDSDRQGVRKPCGSWDDIFAVYCGHDHRNSLVGRWLGVDLGYTPSCGFNDYGDGVEPGGAGIHVFHEEAPAAYETRLLSYRELVGREGGEAGEGFFLQALSGNEGRSG